MPEWDAIADIALTETKDNAVVAALIGLAYFLVMRFVNQKIAAVDKRLEANLQVSSFMRQTQFASFHEVRFEKISDLQSRLGRAEGAFATYFFPGQITVPTAESDKAKALIEASEDLVKCLSESRIYLDVGLSDEIEEWSMKVNVLLGNYMQAITGGNRPGLPWGEAWKANHESLLPLRKKIEDRFREIIGLTAEEQYQKATTESEQGPKFWSIFRWRKPGTKTESRN